MTQMTQPQLMRQIADAMERNPDGWWREFEWVSIHGHVINPPGPDNLFNAMLMGRAVRPKPRTYTLHVEDMPIGEVGHSDIYRNGSDRYTAVLIVDYPDEPTAREALEKLTKAMGGEW